MPVLDPYGLRRVVGPEGAMPQAAERLNPSLLLADDELEIDVDHLNVDSASFEQIKQEANALPSLIAARIRDIVADRGKLHNPVTGSGGMLVGRVRRVGAHHPSAGTLRPGDRIATLVSLTLTPLEIQSIQGVHLQSERVDVTGRAILFASGIFAKLPDDFSDQVSLAILDVCGAPAWVSRLTRPGDRVLVIGAGKSGALACAAAKKSGARVFALDLREDAPRRLVDGGLADVALAADATRPVEVLRVISDETDGRLCDLVVSCASVGGTEMSSILSTRTGGRILFFSMATSFTAAALGAEGCGRDVTMYVGNGYAEGHAEAALGLVRESTALRRFFEARVHS